MSSTFIDGTSFRKHPIIMPEGENPSGFMPHKEKLRNLRLLGEDFSFERKLKRHPRRMLFEGQPPELRARMLERLKLRLDHWEQVRGKRPQPGEWLYAKIICGIEAGYTSAIGACPEVARRLGVRGQRIFAMRSRIRRGTWPPARGQGFKKHRDLSQGARSSSTLGVL
jgi:hypothetical protein